MSTHALVWVKINKNLYKGVFVYYDGYIKSGVGEILLNKFSTLSEVNKLISVDNYINWIDKDSTIKYFNKTEDRHLYIATDKNELCEYLKNYMVDYIYLFEDNQWKVWNNITSESSILSWELLKDDLRILQLTK